MTPETRNALERSIQKWQKNAEATSFEGVRIYGSSCPLCQLFSNNEECEGCPVSAETGQGGCIGSPWEAASSADYRRNLPAFLEAARAEVAFLQSLLPEDSE